MKKLWCLLAGHKTDVKIIEDNAWINVIVECSRCKCLLHDIDQPKRLELSEMKEGQDGN
jgi:hypothetical protein